MNARKATVLSAVFFCSIGWVCSDRATGAEGVAAGDGASLFDTAPAPEAGVTAVVGKTDADTGASGSANVKIGSFGQIDLHVKEQDLATILDLLSLQSQRNIIVSKGVSGSVSANLYGVDFYQAMDALLHSNGYGYREKGNFIYVYTAEQIKALDEADRKTTSKIARLNYLTAADAQAFVTPLLSSAGSIAATGTVTAGFAPSTSDGGANSAAGAETLIIRDYPENVDQIVAVIKELDIRPKQVLVEATILEAKLSENNAFGVNLTVLANFGLDEFLAGPLGVLPALIDGTVKGNGSAVQMTNSISGEQSIQVGILSNSVAAFIDALDRVTDTTILANPKLLVLNRNKADLLVGQRIGYVSTTQTESSTTQTVEFLETGTQLTLRPFISDDGFVRMEIRPQISTGEVRQIASFVVPNEDTQQLTTNILVKSGQTVVMGGLFKETTTVTRKQVPWLGDIPIIGWAGKGQADTVNRDEFIFLVTPTIIKDEAMYAAGEELKDSAELAKIGARQQLLPWSRDKMKSSHLRDALKYMDEGKKDKALWCVNMALSMDPTFEEARQLKEQIKGHRKYVPDDSSLKGAIDVLIQKQLELPEAPVPAPVVEPVAEPASDASPKAEPAQTVAPTAQAQPDATVAPAVQTAPAAEIVPATVPEPAQVQAPQVQAPEAIETEVPIDMVAEINATVEAQLQEPAQVEPAGDEIEMDK
ncbi:MAG: hypothetical protein WD042_18005 [Phycisphaeraceae bacterium]